MKIGFACIFSEVVNGCIKPVEQFKTKTTTLAWLRRQSSSTAEQRLYDIALSNAISAQKLVKHIASLPSHLRMVRLGSDQIPLFTHNSYCDFWQATGTLDHIAHIWQQTGDIAKQHDVRLSFHPGQFVCLASDKEHVVNNSIQEIEYHATIARWMGFCQEFQDFKINIHCSGKLGTAGFKIAFDKLSSEAKKALTVENDEYTIGLDTIIELKDTLPITFDLHHEWCYSGHFVSPTDDRYLRVIDSWKGIRPVVHYSVSRQEYLTDVNTLPCLLDLVSAGFKKAKLRAHSDMFHNSACNQWARSFLDVADIMTESKFKNVASFDLAEKIV